jgi:hypothetical protein
MRGTVVPLGLIWLVALAAAGGCSLSGEVGGGEVSFDLPAAEFEIDTSDVRWQLAPANGVPDVVCGGPAALISDCCQLPGFDCQVYPLTCSDQRCAMVFDYEDAMEMDVGNNVEVLQDRRKWVLARASLDAFRRTVHVTDGFPLKQADLYVAPQGSHSKNATGARLLTSISLVATQSTGAPDAQAAPSVELPPEAQSALSSFLMDFNTPFSLILSAHVVVKSRDMARGEVAVRLTGRVNASF